MGKNVLFFPDDHHVEQSTHIDILIGNRSYDDTKDNQDWDLQGVVLTADINGMLWLLNSSRVFQYILFRKQTPDFMSICEVKLYSTGELSKKRN